MTGCLNDPTCAEICTRIAGVTAAALQIAARLAEALAAAPGSPAAQRVVAAAAAGRLRWRTRLAVAPLLVAAAQHAAARGGGVSGNSDNGSSGGGGSRHPVGTHTGAPIGCGPAGTVSSITAAGDCGSEATSGDGGEGRGYGGVPGGRARSSGPELVPLPLLTPQTLRALPAGPAENLARQGLALVACAAEGVCFLGATDVICAASRPPQFALGLLAGMRVICSGGLDPSACTHGQRLIPTINAAAPGTCYLQETHSSWLRRMTQARCSSPSCLLM